MARNPRFDVLFEPVRIGPVRAPNRFYAVPHASGMTNTMPRMRAGFRGIKAEGGWGVVCTGYVSIHPSSDDTPLPYATLWDENDVRAHALMTDAVHAHGALAGDVVDAVVLDDHAGSETFFDISATQVRYTFSVSPYNVVDFGSNPAELPEDLSIDSQQSAAHNPSFSRT